jgi:hypothetical protein
VAEHVGSWVDTDFATDDFLSHFPLTNDEFARLTECRRLLALLWLIALCLVGPEDDRNPPDTPVRQARRLRALLDARSPTGHEGSSGVRHGGMSRTGARLRPGMNAAALGRPYPTKEEGRRCNRTRSPRY